MKNLLLILFFLPHCCVMSQVSLERQVIGSAAVIGSGSIQLTSTVGQTEHFTYSSQNLILTQGFHQPSSINPLMVDYIFSSGSCTLDALLEIANVSGCSETVDIIVNDELMDGQSVDLIPGNYNIIFDGGVGCTTEIDIVVDDYTVGCGDIVFYNLVTPNGDLNNDTWIIENLHTIDAVAAVVIINRWGMEVWSSDDYLSTGPWDGNNSDGNPLPNATYYYKTTIGVQSYEGFIELVR